ncbi:hypothetical protein [Candidatus Similichlamydia epinepheli]|uniref:hypothetical protein n=1 Tax=Candidatus Similichlamydia epinepheli TaxID=1903953 RepID=UPI0013006073|nr:hypothetical protein [Candidatus Similichlamydia epinepheli]
MSEFINQQLSSHPFSSGHIMYRRYFLAASQILFCGSTLLGNCLRVSLAASKTILAFSGFYMVVVGMDRIFMFFDCMDLLTYPDAIKFNISGYTSEVFKRTHIMSLFIKTWMLTFNLISILFSSSTLSVFHLTLLFIWIIPYLFFDFDVFYPSFFKLSDTVSSCLDSFLFCLNILMTFCFFGFLNVPLL